MTSPTPGQDPVREPAPETRPLHTDDEPADTAVLTHDEQPGERTTTTTPPAAPAGTGASPAPQSAEPARRFRVSTIAFGALLLAAAICTAVATATDVSLDFGVVAIALMIGLGLLLLIGGSRRSD